MPETLILVDVRERSQSGFFDLEWHLPCDRFFGATQNPPKAATTQTTAHKFRRVEFMKIEGRGTRSTST